MKHEYVDAKLASLLSVEPPGTTADLADFFAACWNGERVVYVFLHGDGVGALDEVFNLTEYLLDKWEADFTTWFAEPRYSFRPELLKWLEGHSLQYR
jgi:hypothetical protein